MFSSWSNPPFTMYMRVLQADKYASIYSNPRRKISKIRYPYSTVKVPFSYPYSTVRVVEYSSDCSK